MLPSRNSVYQKSSWNNGEGNGNPLQYSCLENPMDGGAWCPWGRKESDTTERLHFTSHSIILKYASRANTYRTKYHPASRFSFLHLKKHWAFITKTDFTFRLGKYLKRKPTRSSPRTSYETKLRKIEWKFQNILSEMEKSKVREAGGVEFPFTNWRGNKKFSPEITK